MSFTVAEMLENILVPSGRMLGYRFMVAEWLWMMSGMNDVYSISTFNKNIAEFSDNGVTFAGAYGPRINEQIEYALNKIDQDRDTRQAVIVIFSPNPEKSKDIPCTLSLQLLRRDSYLHGVVTMRSSDVWLGLPYDFFNFSMICNVAAHALGLKPGQLTFNLGSSHLYERDLKKVSALTGISGSVRSPDLSRYPADTDKSPLKRFDEMSLRLASVYMNAVRNLRDKNSNPRGSIDDPLASHYYRALTAKTQKETLNALASFNS